MTLVLEAVQPHRYNGELHEPTQAGSMRYSYDSGRHLTCRARVIAHRSTAVTSLGEDRKVFGQRANVRQSKPWFLSVNAVEY